MRPALEHYRCVDIYFQKTRAVRDYGIVYFPPTVVNFPKVSLADHLQWTAIGMISLLPCPPSTTLPSLQVGTIFYNALLELVNISNRVEIVLDVQHIIQTQVNGNKTPPQRDCIPIS